MVSIIIPSLNQRELVANVIDQLRELNKMVEIIVVDNGSIDQTNEIAHASGARFFVVSREGVGSCLAEGLDRAQGDNVILWGADLKLLEPDSISAIVSLLEKDEADFIITSFENSYDPVSELTARPMLKVFFPEIARIKEPFAKVFSGKRDLISKIKIERDEAFGVGLLIDVSQIGVRIKEHPITSVFPSPKPIDEANDRIADSCARTIIERAAKFRRVQSHLISDALDRKIADSGQIENVLEKIDSNKNLLLIGIDQVIIHGHYLESLFHYSGHSDDYLNLINNRNLDFSTKVQRLAKCLNSVPKYIFEKTASTLPIKNKVVETILSLKRIGYQIGLVSDDFSVAAEIFRSRIFADFCVANNIGFKKSVCSGEITFSPLFNPSSPSDSRGICRSHFVDFLKNHEKLSTTKVLSLGGATSDIPMLSRSDRAFWVGDKFTPALPPSTFRLRELAEIFNYLE